MYLSNSQIIFISKSSKMVVLLKMLFISKFSNQKKAIRRVGESQQKLFKIKGAIGQNGDWRASFNEFNEQKEKIQQKNRDTIKGGEAVSKIRGRGRGRGKR
eukprot:TRINITY_DN1912_c0_g1_i1.p7 TRINITY_DN1912_c0_g1~~TRINITY_DN1912_c0_g1_i1.p7  ORF type:complete len:101 (-),score=13.69 TRINITY_DN1912_c0_g1_i1:3-305(-)